MDIERSTALGGAAPQTVRVRAREPWPFVVAGLLVAMGLVLAGLLALATRHGDAPVVDDAYAAGLAWNDDVAARERGADLGWRLDLATATEPGAVRVRVRVTGRGGAPAPAEGVRVRRERPAEGGYDEEFVLAAGENGFEGRVPLPRPGAWCLEARAEGNGAAVEAAAVVMATP